MKTQITHFGTINSDTFQQSYETRITLDGHDVSLDLNFYTVSPDSAGWTAEYENYAALLPDHKRNVEAAIAEDFQKGGETRKYIDFHLKEMPPALLERLMQSADSSLPDDERLLSLLKLKRIGFYPGDRLYAVWDYTPGWQFTDQLIVGNTDNEGKVKYVSWEC